MLSSVIKLIRRKLAGYIGVQTEEAFPVTLDMLMKLLISANLLRC